MVDFGAEQLLKLHELIQRLRQESNARAVFLLDREGQQFASAGEVEGFDPHSLATLETDREHSVLNHEGHESHLKVEPIGADGLLAVVWDGRSSHGPVRLRTARVLPRLNELWGAAGGA